MSDYSELKRLAEAAGSGEWGYDGSYVCPVRREGGTKYVESWRSVADCHQPENTKFIAAANPSAMLALIAEIERLKREEKNDAIAYKAVIERQKELRAEIESQSLQFKEWQASHHSNYCKVADERDQIKAENESLRGQVDTLTEWHANALNEVEALRKDKDRLDALESNFWDVRHNSHPIADTGDSSSSLEIVGHWMDRPHERVIGENYDENLRAAIDQAMKAPAYPPARPEYEFNEIPDFGGGSGNKACRRAESMGIDYDAAISKEPKP